MKANVGIAAPRCGVLTAWLVPVIVLCGALPVLGQGPGQTQSSIQLPDGAGKAIVQSACTGCHDLARVVRPIGNTPEGWQIVLNGMVGLGAKMTSDEVKVVHAYLTSNFPDKAPKPRL